LRIIILLVVCILFYVQFANYYIIGSLYFILCAICELLYYW
jgi:hypothetical protein